MRLLAAISFVVLLVAPAAHAQNEVARKQAAEVAARVPLERPVTGAPYSADTLVESNQTLADGVHIARKTTGRVYRDSEGRIRREEGRDFTNLTPEGAAANRTLMISIVDPVAGYSYSLNPEQRIAWRTALGASGAILGSVEAQQKAAREREMVIVRGRSGGAETRVAGGSLVPRARGTAFTRTDSPLEHKTIDGIPVEGRTTTALIPTGAIGNDQPITITSEEWRSPDLQVLVLTRHVDPRSGESIYRLTNIVRAEPDKSLFIVPSDYTVKDTGIRRNPEQVR